MTDSKDALLDLMEEMLRTKGTQYTKKYFEGLVISYTSDENYPLQEIALAVLSTLRDIDEQKS